MAILEISRSITFRNLFTFAILLFTLVHANAVANIEKQVSVARCFFVYAPILDYAKKSRNSGIETYAMQRMLYIRGFMENLTGDPHFKHVFESNLTQNRSAGILIADSLERASRSNDNARINRELRKAEKCDNELGIKTK